MAEGFRRQRDAEDSIEKNATQSPVFSPLRTGTRLWVYREVVYFVSAAAVADFGDAAGCGTV
jgi:hypothetical protein